MLPTTKLLQPNHMSTEPSLKFPSCLGKRLAGRGNLSWATLSLAMSHCPSEQNSGLGRPQVRRLRVRLACLPSTQWVQALDTIKLQLYKQEFCLTALSNSRSVPQLQIHRASTACFAKYDYDGHPCRKFVSLIKACSRPWWWGWAGLECKSW